MSLNKLYISVNTRDLLVAEGGDEGKAKVKTITCNFHITNEQDENVAL